MPLTFDEAKNKIDHANNKGKGDGGFDQLLLWYGEAFHDLIENSSFEFLDKPMSTTDVGLARGKERDKVKFLWKFKAITIQADNDQAGQKILDHIEQQGKEHSGKGDATKSTAKTKEADDKAKKKPGPGNPDEDNASELYVDAATSKFRAAICYYLIHKRELENFHNCLIDGASLLQTLASYNATKKIFNGYIDLLRDTASLLMDAYQCEYQDDYAEKIAESMVASSLYAEAMRVWSIFSQAVKNRNKNSTVQGVDVVTTELDPQRNQLSDGERAADRATDSAVDSGKK